MGKKILCVEFNNPVEAKDAYRKLSLQKNVRVLEFGETNGSALVLLAEGDQFDLHPFDKYSIIEDPHPDLLPAYFKTILTDFKENLCILESKNLTQLLKACNFLLKIYSYQAIEIYRGKTDQQPALALLCNGNQDFSFPKGYKDVQYKVIKHLNDYVQENFF